jgi:hypothetical protein
MNKAQFLGLLLPILVFRGTTPLYTMEVRDDRHTRYYQGTPLTKQTICNGLGPQMPAIVNQKTKEKIDPHLQSILSGIRLTEPITRQQILDQRQRTGFLRDIDISVPSDSKDGQKKYGVWAADPVNKVFTLWHGDPNTKDSNIWDQANRTDENWRKITVQDSCQTISARACLLALLEAKQRVSSENQRYVKVLPAYLYKLQNNQNNNSDENYLVIHKRPSQAIVLAQKPEIISSIPASAIDVIFSMIIDERSGAAGALWDNNNIAVEADENGIFKRWVIGLCEKPNNQEPDIFFNQGPGFHANCQLEGLRTLAVVLNKSNDKAQLHRLLDLIEVHKTQLCEEKGEQSRWTKIKDQVLALRQQR